ncbi:MAG: 2-hydroxyacid dehydrogenase [Thermodesulfobacteriota bacterium]
MNKILIGYPLDRYKEFDDILLSIGQRYKVVVKDYDYEWLRKNIRHFEIVIPSLKVTIDDAIMREANKLKLIFTPTTGCDHIQLGKNYKGLRIFSLNHFRKEITSISSTAELAFSMILALSRRIVLAQRNIVDKARWDRNSFLGKELTGKVIGIVGLGRIGKKIGNYGKAFGMQVTYWDKRKSSKWTKISSLNELLSRSDYIVLSLPLDKDTYHLINRRNIKFIKEGSILVNISRGKIAEEKALCEALERGFLWGVGVDVLEFELEDFRKSPLYLYAVKHPKTNIVITPHIGGATIDAWRKVFPLVIGRILKRKEWYGT